MLITLFYIFKIQRLLIYTISVKHCYENYLISKKIYFQILKVDLGGPY